VGRVPSLTHGESFIHYGLERLELGVLGAIDVPLSCMYLRKRRFQTAKKPEAHVWFAHLMQVTLEDGGRAVSLSGSTCRWLLLS
jgi:hypothetical protein